MRNLKPYFTSFHRSGKIRGADTRRKSSESSVSASVRVSTDYYVSGKNNALFWKQSMFHSHSADFIIMRQFLFFGEFSQYFYLFRGFDVFIRTKMIRNKNDFIFIKNLLSACPTEFADRYRSSNIVCESYVNLAFDKFARRYSRFPASLCQNLFSNSHSHSFSIISNFS
ncbi:MAG: hypothetical protein BWY26_00769 [Elusimicrobia bacterium ADurb.Bin231]|nr:MAG: hypothetical protein BWY26_00769 [Elusimicrobia bacterium ADurb.Bin231]